MCGTQITFRLGNTLTIIYRLLHNSTTPLLCPSMDRNHKYCLESDHSDDLNNSGMVVCHVRTFNPGVYYTLYMPTLLVHPWICTVQAYRTGCAHHPLVVHQCHCATGLLFAGDVWLEHFFSLNCLKTPDPLSPVPGPLPRQRHWTMILNLKVVCTLEETSQSSNYAWHEASQYLKTCITEMCELHGGNHQTLRLITPEVPICATNRVKIYRALLGHMIAFFFSHGKTLPLPWLTCTCKANKSRESQ